MAFVNLSLLAGAVLVAVPIVLHLIMRQRAKHLVFPALQFLQKRRETNRRRLKLRHSLLLALRCALVATLALLLARPSVGSTLFGNALLIGGIMLLLLFVVSLTATVAFLRRGPLLTGALVALAVSLLVSLLVVVAATIRGRGEAQIGDRQAPVAVLLVFDTAPRMAYRHQNLTRLEQARQTADWLIDQLPVGSDIAVADASLTHHGFLHDRSAAPTGTRRAADYEYCHASAGDGSPWIRRAAATRARSQRALHLYRSGSGRMGDGYRTANPRHASQREVDHEYFRDRRWRGYTAQLRIGTTDIVCAKPHGPHSTSTAHRIDARRHTLQTWRRIVSGIP